ncbi:MAG TPA: hypothetical protein ENN72_03150 [Firmicutes bacterium]|nr:hypothetical protein [Bacillota bacterium]
MKRTAVLIFLLFIFSGLLAAGPYDFGIGFVLGEPTGVTVKYWNSEKSAFDGAIAWSFSGEKKLHLHADYLVHSLNAYTIDKAPFHLYYGIGVRIKFSDKTRLGSRIPLGTSYTPTSAPLEIFCEVIPLLDLVPDTDFQLNAGLGLRYYF